MFTASKTPSKFFFWGVFDWTIAQEIRWALEQLGFWETGEIKITKERYGNETVGARHCSANLSVPDTETAQDYIHALNGNHVRGISVPEESRGFWFFVGHHFRKNNTTIV